MYLSNRRPSLSPPVRVVIRGPNSVLRRLGLGDVVLDQAKQRLLDAGYAGVECRTETVYYPNGGGGSYTQNICSAPGYDGGFNADLALKMSPAMLAAQRQGELAAGEGHLQDYFQSTLGAPNIAVSQVTGTAASGAATVAADWARPPVLPPPPVPTPVKMPIRVPDAPSPAAQQVSTKAVGTTPGIAESVLGGALSGLPMWAIGLGVLALVPLIFGGRR